MGIFHKTLSDAINATEAGEYNKAAEILEQHLTDKVLSEEIETLGRLKRAIVSYEDLLRSAIGMLRNPDILILKNTALTVIDNAKKALTAIERRMQSLQPLIKQED